MKQSVLFRIASDPPARIWGGIGDLDIPADIVEPSTARYLGGGELVNIPDLEQLINGTSAQLAITVSGVSTSTVALAVEEAPSIQNAKCHVGVAYFEDDWSLVEVEWLAVLRASSLTTASQANDTGRTRSITLSIFSEDANRSRAPISFWTDADQRRRSPTDSFFDHIAGISSGTSRRFGPT